MGSRRIITRQKNVLHIQKMAVHTDCPLPRSRSCVARHAAVSQVEFTHAAVMHNGWLRNDNYHSIFDHLALEPVHFTKHTSPSSRRRDGSFGFDTGKHCVVSTCASLVRTASISPRRALREMCRCQRQTVRGGKCKVPTGLAWNATSRRCPRTASCAYQC